MRLAPPEQHQQAAEPANGECERCELEGRQVAAGGRHDGQRRPDEDGAEPGEGGRFFRAHARQLRQRPVSSITCAPGTKPLRAAN